MILTANDRVTIFNRVGLVVPAAIKADSHLVIAEAAELLDWTGQAPDPFDLAVRLRVMHTAVNHLLGAAHAAQDGGTVELSPERLLAETIAYYAAATA
jgi:hypothetical protein